MRALAHFAADAVALAFGGVLGFQLQLFTLVLRLVQLFFGGIRPFVRFGNDLVAGVSGGVGRGLSGEHREASSSADKAMIDFFISPSFLRYVPFVMKQDGMKRPLNDLRIGLKPKIDIKFY